MECTTDGCDKKSVARKMCRTHYMQWWADQRGLTGKRRTKKPEGAQKLPATIHGNKGMKAASPAWIAWEQGDMAGVVDELLARTTRDGDCYRWADSHTKEGYGYIGAGKRGASMKAHRMMYAAAYDEQPVSVHHTCAVRDCINPGHLQSVSSQANTAEMLERNAYRKRIAELEAMVMELQSSPAPAPMQAARP